MEKSCCVVAPLVGAWIEISQLQACPPELLSLPSWERGLKYIDSSSIKKYTNVAPLVGAWIEIVSSAAALLFLVSRSPRGSVD